MLEEETNKRPPAGERERDEIAVVQSTRSCNKMP